MVAVSAALSLLLTTFLPACAVGQRTLKLDPPQELPYIRDYFYAGGRYIDDGTGTGQHVFVDQIYVERLSPVKGRLKQYPIVFIHGQGLTGDNWLNKPDGGRGWASCYTSYGYIVYIIDQAFRGRSPWLPGNGTLNVYRAEYIEQLLTASQDFNLWPQANLHTQWPGSGRIGDSIFDAFYASSVQFLSDGLVQQSAVQAAGAALLDRVAKPVILVAHSQGGLMPWLIADARPHLVHAIVAIEPTGPPFHEAVFSNTSDRAYGLTDIPLTYAPPVIDPATDLVRQTISPELPGNASCILQADEHPKQLVNLKNIPVAVVTAEASYHVPYDWCTVKYLRQAGVQTDHLYLPEQGIHGNGHMLFLEKNSDRIAELLKDWIERGSRR